MDYIAYKQQTKKSDTLYIDEGLISSNAQLVKLIEDWLSDMGCNVKTTVISFRDLVYSVYNHAFTHSECTRDNYHIDIDRFCGGYRIVLTKNEEKLAYKQKYD